MKLKWTEHITYVKNKIYNSSAILFKARNFQYLLYCIEIRGTALLYI